MDYIFKFVLIGDSAVGKSSILSRFVDDDFVTSHNSTIGADLKVNTITTGGKQVKIQLWDTSGNPRFKTIAHSFYRGAHAVLIVFDISNQASFDRIPEWIEDAERYSVGSLKAIVGNKSDLREYTFPTPVSLVKTNELCNSFGMKYYEVSAKEPLRDDDNNSIIEMMKGVCDQIIEKMNHSPDYTTQTYKRLMSSHHKKSKKNYLEPISEAGPINHPVEKDSTCCFFGWW